MGARTIAKAEKPESTYPRFDNMPVEKMAMEMKRLALEYGEADKATATLYKELDALRKIYLPDAMTKANIESVRYDGIGLLSVRSAAYCKTKNAEALMEWLTENDHASLIKSNVNSSSLKSFITEMIKGGNSIPDEDILEYTPYDYVVILK